MTIENDHLNCMKMVSCKVTTIENQKGYRGIREHWRLIGGVGGLAGNFGSVGGIRGVGVSGVMGG